jgi:cytochrome P450
MVLYPEVQKKAQAQLEEVCGNRLPEMEDFDKLPYIRCIMKETLRWLPTAILGAVVCQSKRARKQGEFTNA